MLKRLILIVSLCRLLAAQPAQAPDTPAGRQFAHWLEVFNRGQRDEVQRFLKENDPRAARHLDDQMEFRRMTGGFDFKKVEESAPEKLTGIVKERDSDNIARLRWRWIPPPRISSSSSASNLFPSLKTLPPQPG